MFFDWHPLKRSPPYLLVLICARVTADADYQRSQPPATLAFSVSFLPPQTSSDPVIGREPSFLP